MYRYSSHSLQGGACLDCGTVHIVNEVLAHDIAGIHANVSHAT
jgi:hypothetical protein